MTQRSGSEPIGALRGLALLIPALGMAACVAQQRAAPTQLRGTPQVISGDLIELEGRRLRLAGIDAPELGQRCLLRERLYDCGALARSALLDLTAGVEVVCWPQVSRTQNSLHRISGSKGHEMYSSSVIQLPTFVTFNVTTFETITLVPGPAAALTARCSAQGYDLSEGMVYTGWALIPPASGTTYAAQQARAKSAGHGLWRGRFVAPWDWVRGKRLPEESDG